MESEHKLIAAHVTNTSCKDVLVCRYFASIACTPSTWSERGGGGGIETRGSDIAPLSRWQLWKFFGILPPKRFA